MLTEDAIALLALLRSFVGPHAKGMGPDVDQLIELWRPNDPSTLRPALDELDRRGFVSVRGGMAMATNAIRTQYGVNGIVSVTVTETMQAYRDGLGMD